MVLIESLKLFSTIFHKMDIIPPFQIKIIIPHIPSFHLHDVQEQMKLTNNDTVRIASAF